MNIIIFGASGMAGCEVLKHALNNPSIKNIVAITRSPLKESSEKLTQIEQKNFLDYSNLRSEFEEADVIIWCLGISQTQVTKEKYIEITYDYTIAAAKAAVKANPLIEFYFLSGDGADYNGKARSLFGKTKGLAEKALLDIGFKRLHFFRPGAIMAVGEYKNEPFAYKLVSWMFPTFKKLFPNMIITNAELAKAIFNIVQNGYEEIIVSEKELIKLGRS